jgi:hypothetical protein
MRIINQDEAEKKEVTLTFMNVKYIYNIFYNNYHFRFQGEGIEYWVALNECLRNIRNNTTIRERATIPDEISESDATSIRIIVDLLNPFAGLTNDIQGNGVTSSLVILGLLDAVTRKIKKLLNVRER